MKTQTNEADVNAELKEFFIDQLQDAYWTQNSCMKTTLKLHSSASTKTVQHSAVPVFNGQKDEHYEIAMYSGLISLAKLFGYDNAMDIMQQVLEEKKQADELLMQATQNKVHLSVQP